MPVQFNPVSEYQRTYKPHQSTLSSTFEPSEEQARASAGKPSTLVYPLHSREPPLQRKRRVQSPVNHVVYSRNPLPEFPDSARQERYAPVSQQDTYALLGPQDKFSNNVAYRLHRTESVDNVVQRRANDALSVVDENIAEDDRGRNVKRNAERYNEAVSRQSNKRVKVVRDNGTATDQTNANGAVLVDEPPNAPRGRVQTPLLDELEFDPRPRANGSSSKPAKAAEPVAQVENGSNRQAPDDYYAKRYQLGLEARAQRVGPARLKESEYQRQYDAFGHGRPAAPVLSAYDIFHRSRSLPLHTRLRKQPRNEAPVNAQPEQPTRYEPLNYQPARQEPSRNEPIEREEAAQASAREDARRAGVASNLYRTEYGRNYVNWQGTVEKLADHAKRAITRSRSLDSLRAPNRQDVPSRYMPRTVEVGGRTYKLADLFGAVTRGRRWPTEYAASFRNHFAPGDEDSSKKAQKNAVEKTASVADVPPLSELTELRERAGENRERARGSHFSKEHSTQLLSHRARLWDVTPRSSSTFDKPDERPADAGAAAVADGSVNANEDVDAVERLDGAGEAGAEQDRLEHEAALNVEEVANGDLKGPINRPIRIPADADGRVPTPRLAKFDPYTGRPIQRHHLDRTTPFIGTLFTQPTTVAAVDTPVSPSSHASSARSTPRIPYDAARYTDRVAAAAERAKRVAEMRPAGLPTPWEERPRVLVTREDDAPAAGRLLRTTAVENGSQKRPATAQRRAAGKTTFDANPLADSSVRYDRPLAQKQRPQTAPASDRSRQSEVHTEIERTQVVQTDEPSFKNERVQADLSARSSTSSMSLAKETLERARTRTDFWRAKRT